MKLDIYQTGPMPVNTYVLFDEISKETVIIDVGGDFEEIKQNIEQNEGKIKFVLNTHGHFDHVLGDVYITQKYPNIPIYMHKDDLPHIQNLKDEVKYFGINVDDCEIKISDFIDESSQLYIGNSVIKILHTPGHSKGSLSFYIENMLFSGDALFYRSIGRTDFYDGDFDTLIRSIKNKILILPDDTTVYPGHGIKTKIRDEKKFNEYLT